MKAFTFKTAAILAIVAPSAMAATTTLDTLLGGGSIVSYNGLLTFSDFSYYGGLNAPDASEIGVTTDNANDANCITFATPSFFSFDKNLDLTIEYVVTAAAGYKIVGVEMKSTGDADGTGAAGVYKVVEDTASLKNIFLEAFVNSTESKDLPPAQAYLIRDDAFVVPGRDGFGGLSDITQCYELATGVPTPTAALAGLAMLGFAGIRRRREN